MKNKKWIPIIQESQWGKPSTITFDDKQTAKQTKDFLDKLGPPMIIELPCLTFIGTLNEPFYKCHNCGKEEWQHKL